MVVAVAVCVGVIYIAVAVSLACRCGCIITSRSGHEFWCNIQSSSLCWQHTYYMYVYNDKYGSYLGLPLRAA